MDTKRYDEQLISDPTTENSETNEVTTTEAVGESGGHLEISGLSSKLLEEETGKDLKDEGTEDQDHMVNDNNVEALREKSPKDLMVNDNNDSKVLLCNSEIVDVKATDQSSATVKDSDAELENVSVKESVDAPNSEHEKKQMGMQSENGETQVASRSSASKKRTRSLSPGADVNNGDKRLAVAAICSFYAKGWCIKGSSCSFLHIKDNSDQCSEKDQVRFSEGLKCSADSSKSPILHYPLDSSFENISSFPPKFERSSERSLPRDFAEIQGWDGLHDKNKFLWQQRKDSLSMAYVDGQKLPSNFSSSLSMNRGSSTFRDGLPPEFGLSSGGSKLFSNHSNVSPSSRLGVMDELGNVACPRLPTDQISPILRTFNSNTDPMSGMLSSRLPTSNVSSFPFTSSSLSLIGSHRLPIIDRDYHVTTPASLMRSSSPFSASESDNSLTNVSMKSFECRTKYSSTDWEPSVPFRPSFLISQINIASQYDPFLDSIEVPRVVDGSSTISFNGQGHEASTISALCRTSGNFMVPGSSGSEFIDESGTLSSRNKGIENKNDDTRYDYGNTSVTIEAKAQGSCGVDISNGTNTKEDDPSGISHGKKVTKTKKIVTKSELKHPHVALPEKEFEADSEREIGDMDGKHLMDGDVHKESKATRHFRAALVELVKELLKPKWREGHLKKDAHNTVVKKTLDKVLGTLQSHQIPTTVESAKQYLSLSRPKIAKLVEGYVSKYGKS